MNISRWNVFRNSLFYINTLLTDGEEEMERDRDIITDIDKDSNSQKI